MPHNVCFIDKKGMVGTCSMECLSIEEIADIMENDGTIDCKRCKFYEKYKGREEDEFVYCSWLGQLKEYNLSDTTCTEPQFTIRCPHCEGIVWVRPSMKGREVKSIKVLKEGK